MLQIVDLSKSFGAQVIFDRISFTLGSGERLGVVGRNGEGKTTLFKLILDEEHPDSGKISTPSDYRIGHMAQHLAFTKGTLLEEACTGLKPEESDQHYKVEKILCGLGFSMADMTRPLDEFAGGFHIRLNLAKVLVSSPNLLLLDEPTNYLDIVSIRWLQRFLRSWRGELMLITHDREFMDSVTTHTLGIHRQKVRRVKGGTQKLYDQLALDEEVYEKVRRTEERKRKEIESFIDRFRAQARRASVVQSRIRALEKLPPKEELAAIATLDFRFNVAGVEAQTLVEVRDLTFSYPGSEPLIRKLSFTVDRGDRLAVVGKNGKGKTTLLKLLARELTADAGQVRFHPDSRVGYFGQTNVDRLRPDLTVEDEVDSANPTLGRTAVRGICGAMMFDGAKAEKRISVLSGGERSRTLLGKLLAQSSNLLFLDEPTSHLDQWSVEALMDALDAYTGAVVMVTHSEMILNRLGRSGGRDGEGATKKANPRASRLIVFHRGRVEEFLGTYEEFLEKVGWEDEETVDPGDAGPEAEARGAASKKEIRQKRSQITQERSRVLSPLKKRMEALEEEITRLERQITSQNEELIEASRGGQGERIAALARSVGQARQRVDELFDALEQVTLEFERESGRFDKRLEGV
ncbi:MAG: ATP-binding cassette domain-containing protein [Candidatus Riflebacteria bacterium]|nr:ATP-binding cassette domain-containing protein [Candidatus Riflebacteria bacterium]